MFNNKSGASEKPYTLIKQASLLLCSVLAVGSVHAQSGGYYGSRTPKIISVPTTDNNGTYTVSWSGFTPYFSALTENGKTITTGSALNITFTNKPAGTYTYRVSGCMGAGYDCGASASKTIIVSGAHVEPAPPSTLSRESIEAFLRDAPKDGKVLANLVGDEIEARLNEANLTLDERGLTYSERFPNEQIRGGCTANVSLRNLYATANISSDSRFDIVMDSLSKPIVASVELVGTVEGGGKLKMRFGKKFLGKCIRYGSNTITGNLKVDLTIKTSLMIKLNPTKVASAPGTVKIALNPEVKLNGKMTAVNDLDISGVDLALLTPVIGDVVGRANQLAGGSVVGRLLTGGLPNGGLTGELLNFYFLDHLIENFGEKALNKQASSANTKFEKYLAQEEASLLRQLTENIPQEYVIPYSAHHENQMLSFVSHYALRFMPSSDYIKANGADVLYYLLVGDEEALVNKLGTSAACMAAVEALNVKSMTKDPAPAGFSSTSSSEFCSTADRKDWLGNADPNVSGYSGESAWTLLPSTRMNFSSIFPIGNKQPYTKRVNYRTVSNIIDGYRKVVDQNAYSRAMSACYRRAYQTYGNYGPPRSVLCPDSMINQFTTKEPIVRGTGTCQLEMRIYKNNGPTSGLKPLLAVHGGGWKYRGAGFYGMESQISHFTNRGFVVFAPFYRLTGTSDGSTECNHAGGEEIISDIDAALKWVRNNQHKYGAASYEKVRLFGQSAGAHLSGWLLAHRSADIEKALLLYAPTDAEDYIQQYKYLADDNAATQPSADYEGMFQGLGFNAISGFMGAVNDEGESVLESVDTSDSFVQDNTFTNIVANNPSAYPPVFMVHGQVDTTVPSIQSVRLCNAYSGNPGYGPANNNDSSIKQTFNCGQGSKLHLLKEADHMIELCLAPLKCQAGESQSALNAAADSLNEGWNWLAQ